MSRLSVIVPTRDRREVLLHTLDRLAAQRGAGDVEIVVVDNGSADGSAEAVRARHPGVTVVAEPRPGPAAARNTGARTASGDLLLFLGDDMAPAADDLLAAHRRLHAARPEPEYGVLGRVAWRPDLPVTPFMHWLEHGGPQFDFARLPAGRVEPSRHFITAHVSIKHAVFEPFDERFPYAAVEDAELGLRLERRGLWLDYRPELLVHHDHPTSVEAAVARMQRTGESARLLLELHPDAFADWPRPRRRWRLYPAAAAAARAVLRGRPPRAVRERAWTVLMLDAYARGFGRP